VLAALAGCMKIYPDPELPDIEVSWQIEDCNADAGDVVVSLIAVDDNTRADVTVPCVDAAVAFRDVARVRYRIEALLYDKQGEVYSNAQSEADLRDGLSERIGLYFGGFSNFRVAWVFDMGETCASVGATSVLVQFNEAGSLVFAPRAPCEQSPFFTFAPDGTYSLVLRADGPTGAVAVSEETAEFDIQSPDVINLGTLTLVPCGAACP
jgi:hypothetical protein